MGGEQYGRRNSSEESPYAVAEMVGFGNNPQYFSQIFMRNVGMKPQEYKKQRKE